MLSELPSKGLNGRQFRQNHEIDQKIRELQNLKQGLLHIEQCPKLQKTIWRARNSRKILSVSLKKQRNKTVKNPLDLKLT